MTKIKGQNLRLRVGGSIVQRCIAASQSCSVHLAAQVEDATTKDSDGDWDEKEVTGLSWDASVDAAVADALILSRSYDAAEDFDVEVDQGFYGPAEKFTLKQGCKITVETAQADMKIYEYAPDDDSYSLLTSVTGQSEITYTNESSAAKIIAFATSETQGDFDLDITDTAVSADALTDYMKSKTLLTVVFTTTTGSQNRYFGQRIATGTAYISDINITSQNRQTVTFSCKLTGVGELSFT